MMKAAAPITGGINCPPVEPTDSIAAERTGVKPERTMVGMVTIPTASTFDTALPEIMPNKAEPTTAIFAAPPRKCPIADIETNAPKIIAILEHAGVKISAESYDPHGKILREWK